MTTLLGRRFAEMPDIAPPVPRIYRYLRIEAVKGKKKRVSISNKTEGSVGDLQLPQIDGKNQNAEDNILKRNVDDRKKDTNSDLIGFRGPSREDILRASLTTCSAIGTSAVCIQQASHWAAESGWSVPDSTLLFAYDVEAWQLYVLLGLVGSVSIIRQILLQLWPEFSESSDVANKQVLGPLRLSDFAVAAVLPGLSEELLFRGALLPLFGLDWKGVTITGVIFGVLHLNGGRRTAFAIWASFVGVLYGFGCIATRNVLIPMVAHAVNNLIGALIWKANQQDILNKN